MNPPARKSNSSARCHLASSTNSTVYDLAVIGGGPAGMMAAGRAVERGLKVILLEKNADLGKKLLISGGGRCNVTNAEFDNRTLLTKFKGSGKFLFSAFAQHSVKETLEFFHSRGMKTKVEEGGRVFPLSDKAESVWNVLLENMKDTKHGGSNPVTIINGAEVVGFEIFNSARLGALSEQQGRVKGTCERDWCEHEEFPTK
jgi:predicted Rossmann fold flavoprotein